ncbi:hypothetical protein K3495_g7765 [Podosphaera aphanis]|nr:hypothetical protein K3495_g7765 [Podosphaera aphanis]
MAPAVSFASTTLNYPLYACDFDPRDPSKLAVGGGGGTSKTGVGNKITLLDASKGEDLTKVAEIKLSQDDDNPTSLAVGRDHLIYAGVNSHPSVIKAGQNLHLRVYEAKEVETHGNREIRISEKSKYSLFSKAELDIYQRITRFTRPFSGQAQLGVITTGLAEESEIVLFDTASRQEPKLRTRLRSTRETMDVDLIQISATDYQLAYCDEYAVYTKKIPAVVENEDSDCIYLDAPPLDRRVSKSTTIRALRWLTKDYLILLVNYYGNRGVMLQILGIPSGGKGQGRLAQNIHLPSRVTKATGLTVADLNPPQQPGKFPDQSQFLIAVAGHDKSLYLFRIDATIENGVSKLSNFARFRSFRDVHPLQITAIAFSNPQSVLADSMFASTRVVRLASVGICNTVAVHTLTLHPIPLAARDDKNKTPRYVVNPPFRIATKANAAWLSFMIVVLTAIFIQAVFEIRGATPAYLGARERVPLRWQEALRRHSPTISTTGSHLGQTSTASVNPDDGETDFHSDMPQGSTYYYY